MVGSSEGDKDGVSEWTELGDDDGAMDGTGLGSKPSSELAVTYGLAEGAPVGVIGAKVGASDGVML
jgi:hypothetical protein